MDPNRFVRTKEWSERVGVWDLRQYVLNNIEVSDLVAIDAVFWPGFVERLGAVFVDFLFDETSYVQWLAEASGDIQAVEKTLNHLHLWDIFQPKSEQEYSALVELSWKIAETWRLAARTAFPNRIFSVEVADETEDYGPTIVLYSN
jgi:hypothetical protein